MNKYQNYLLLFFCFTFLTSVLSVMKFPGGTRLFVVQMSSMEPTIKAKSLIVVRPERIYKKDDIITFIDQDPDKGQYPTVTHRLQTIVNQNGQVLFMTKGDANRFSDEYFVPYNQVVGKVVKIIPYFGWLVDIVKSKLGIILFVFLPAIMIVRNELLNIVQQMKKN